MDLSVVLLSYNTREFTEGALRTVLEAADGLEAEVYLVDNASRDGSADMVEARFPRVKLLRNPRNVGFSAGNNVALRQVTGRHVLLLNTDTIVRRDTLRRMVEFMDSHPEAGAAGCRILNPDGTLQLDSRRGLPTPMAAFCKLSGLSRIFPKSQRFARYNMTYLDPDETNEVDVLSGSCMMVRKEAMDQVGLLDEDYFMYGEDIDWCYRIRSAGWRIYYVPTTEIIHFRGESGRSEPLRILYRKSKAMSIFVRKHMRHRYRFFPPSLLQGAIALHALLKLGTGACRHLLLPAIDAALVMLGLWLAIGLRYHPGLTPLIHAIEGAATHAGLDAHPTRWLVPPFYSRDQWLAVYFVSTAIWVLAFYLVGLYDRRRNSVLWPVAGVALGFAGLVTTVFFLKAYNFSRLAATAAWLFNTVLLVGWRLTARALVAHRSSGRRRTLVVGTDRAAERFIQTLEQLPTHPFQIIGLVGETATTRGGMVAGRPVVGILGELHALVAEYDVDQLVFTAAAVSHALDQLGMRWKLRRLRLRMLPQSFADGDSDSTPRTAAQLPLIELASSR
jgi:GT2 family glycosyltransferase